jgi:hypothetical protein
MEPTLEQLKYPIGSWKWPESVSAEEIKEAIAVIADFPHQMIEAIKGLSDEQLDIQYRPDGWTIRQVVHHTADSHMNAYIRFKWALTEDNPIIKPYDQNQWAELIDSKGDPAISILVLTGIHKRWIDIMENMSASDWDRKLKHPDHSLQLTLRLLARQYHWHCRHHLQHILQLRKRRGF